VFQLRKRHASSLAHAVFHEKGKVAFYYKNSYISETCRKGAGRVGLVSGLPIVAGNVRAENDKRGHGWIWG
jgi:hypothetical protein